MYIYIKFCVFPSTGEPAAVKVMESIHEVLEEIEEEYLVLRDLSDHPNIPEFYGIFIKQDTASEDQIWLVMEVGILRNISVLNLQYKEMFYSMTVIS